MLDDSFKIRYRFLPVAVSHTLSEDTFLHNHGEFEMLYIMKGNSLIKINGKEYSAKKGDMFFINPFEIHSVFINDKKNYSHKCICFDCSLITDNEIKSSLINEEITVIHHIDSESPHKNTLKKYFSNLEDAHKENGKYSKSEASAYATLIFTYFFKNGLTNAKTKEKNQNRIFCSSILKYIGKHYSEDISSKKIAAKLSYNQSYFCRTFKKNFGCCFSSYLNIYRISKSRMLLEEGGKSITEIALECGFNTPSYFSKCFKSELGILPSEYRQKSDEHNML